MTILSTIETKAIFLYTVNQTLLTIHYTHSPSGVTFTFESSQAAFDVYTQISRKSTVEFKHLGYVPMPQGY